MDHLEEQPVQLNGSEGSTLIASPVSMEKKSRELKPLSCPRKGAPSAPPAPKQQTNERQGSNVDENPSDGMERDSPAADSPSNDQADENTANQVPTTPATAGAGAVQEVWKTEDPRVRNGKKVFVKSKGQGRNTESFDPASTIVRPAMRILVGSAKGLGEQVLKHDDVIIVPNFFCEEDDWALYNTLVHEMRAAQAQGIQQSEWISWHEGAHLISKNPQSETYRKLVQRMSDYFHVSSAGTRLNWYNDVDDWKPFHHDSAAFNPQRAKQQNFTVGLSLGATRELAFLHAKSGTKIYFPQTNGSLFAFGRDVNIHWKHAVNALSADDKVREHAHGQPLCDADVPVGRISIILWGLCGQVKEEAGSPPMLSDGQGHHMHRPNHQHQQHRRPRSNSRERRPDARDAQHHQQRERGLAAEQHSGYSGDHRPREQHWDRPRDQVPHQQHRDSRDRDQVRDRERPAGQAREDHRGGEQHAHRDSRDRKHGRSWEQSEPAAHQPYQQHGHEQRWHNNDHRDKQFRR